MAPYGKDKEKGKIFFACPNSYTQVVYSAAEVLFTGITAYFPGILTYSAKQLRHAASSTEQLLDSSTVFWETTIV